MGSSEMTVLEIRRVAARILKALSSVVIGYPAEQRLILAGLLANGHVLLEGVPGVAKTTMARALVRLVGLSEKEERVIGGVAYRGFSRIQFTPDLMPADITGSLIYNPKTMSFEPRLGPIFAYIVLADEINRATPRTQAAMLQAMQEREVTIGGTTYKLENRREGKFFYVIATQNPVEQEGTYPLPEAQLDRFMMRIIIGYPPSLEEEKEIYRLHSTSLKEPVESLEPVTTPEWVVAAQEYIIRNVEAPDDVLEYVTRIVRGTRQEILRPVSKYFELGASPRAGIYLIRVAKVLAAMRGSETVTIMDVEKALFPVLNHRLIPNLELVVEYGGGYEARLRVIKEGLEFVKKNMV